MTTALLGLAGGCGGSGGCDDPLGLGMEPIPGGFPIEGRAQNAINVRVTDSGLDQIEAMIPDLVPSLLGGGALGDIGGGATENGILAIAVPAMPPTSLSILGDLLVCPDGAKPDASPPECMIELDLNQMVLDLQPTAPHNLVVDATIPIRIQKLPITIDSLFDISTAINITDGGCGSDGFVGLDAEINVALAIDPVTGHVSRYGMTNFELGSLADGLDMDALIDGVEFCPSNLGNGLLNAIMPLLGGLLGGQLAGPLDGALEGITCSTMGPDCPAGSAPDDSDVCRWSDDNECVPMALGLEGRMDMGSLLASVAPGMSAGVDILGALGGEAERPGGGGEHWGDMNPANNGMTLSLMAGAAAAPPSGCVPLAESIVPQNIPQPDEMIANTIPGWTGDGPHFGLSLSEQYLNHMMVGIYNAGTLCIPVDGDLLDGLLTTSLLSTALSLDSMKTIARDGTPGALSLFVRPQKPPQIKIGNGGPEDSEEATTDPLLLVTMPEAEIDFYLFSNDRYVRGFTAKFDLVAPVNLLVNAEGALEIAMGDLGMNNTQLINAPLLAPSQLPGAAQGLADLVGGLVGNALGGALAPIDLSSLTASFGISLNIPEGGIRKLEKDSDRFLGIFAGFGAAPVAEPYIVGSETSAVIRSSQILAEGLQFETVTDENRPRFVIDASSSLDGGGQAIQYQYRLNGGVWSFLKDSSRLEIDNPILMIQGRHQLEVRSRVAGMPTTTDRSPVKLELLVDKTAPSLKVGTYVRGGAVEVTVSDWVSAADDVQVRWSLDDGAFTEWVPSSTVDTIDVASAANLLVEATDESGNTGSQRQRLIRGKVDPTLAAPADPGACGCRVPGGTTNTTAPWGLAGIAALAAGFVVRRRRATKSTSAKTRGLLRRVGGAAALLVAGMWTAGCSCSAEKEAPGGEKPPPPEPLTCPNGTQCTHIVPGVIGAYASTAQGSDGTHYVAAYSDRGAAKMVEAGDELLAFGDLAFGTWDGTSVTWETVDGVPTEELDPEYYDVDGFRGGVASAGDNVGLWTSIAIAPDGTPMIAYFDVTNGALKFASKSGDTWSTHTVAQADAGDLGRYATLKLIGGKPVIAFLAVEGQEDGAVHSAVRIATGSSGIPSSASDWSFEDAAMATDTPCLLNLCAGDYACRSDTLKCDLEVEADAETCDCSSSEGCFAMEGGGAACVGTATPGIRTWEKYPVASGLYISLLETADGLGVVYYDRYHGNLMSARQVGGTWEAPVVLDGQTTDAEGAPVDTGDAGIGASAFVGANGDWHVTYVDGITEAVQYMMIAGGTAPMARETVDKGFTPGVGQALIGDDSSVFVADDGTVSVSYADSTNGKTFFARGTVAGEAHDWAVTALDVPGFSGGFSELVGDAGALEVMTWSRSYDETEAPFARAEILFVKP